VDGEWRHKGQSHYFIKEEDARDAFDAFITKEDEEAGKGSIMTNARYWVDDPDLLAKHWAERTTALARYYERQLAAGWPQAGESNPFVLLIAPSQHWCRSSIALGRAGVPNVVLGSLEGRYVPIARC